MNDFLINMAVRPRPSSSTRLTTGEVFDYLPTTGKKEIIQKFRMYRFGSDPDPPELVPFWHSVYACISKANEGTRDEKAAARDLFKDVYGVDFPNKIEQRKYLTAAYQLEKNTMDQLFDYAEKHNYPLVNILHLRQNLPSPEEMGDEEKLIFDIDTENGMQQITGPTTKRGRRGRIEDPYKKIMDAINFGISLTKTLKENFFVHTIFEKIPPEMKARITDPPENTHIRLMTMIPYVFNSENGTINTSAVSSETHATIIICDISEKGEKRICFTEPNRAILGYLRRYHKRQRTKKDAENIFNNYVEDKFNELLSTDVERFLETLTSEDEILKENIKILRTFAEGSKKYILDLPIRNDLGPNCARLSIYIIFYYCFISTMSSELTYFAIYINTNKTADAKSLEMGTSTRNFNKIRALLYGLLMHAKESTSDVPQIGKEHSFDPKRAKMEEEEQDSETAEDKLTRKIEQNHEDEEYQPKPPKMGRGKSYRCRVHLY